MELTSVVKELYIAQQRLGNATKMVLQQADQKAQAEMMYRKELAKEMMKLRDTKLPVSLIGDVARGNLAELKMERDTAEAVYKATLSSMRAMEVQVSALQTIARYQADI